MNPLVTIVIPTHNRLALVQQAIASVIAQTYPHWELMIVDDGSDDGSAELFAEISDPRIRLLKWQHCGNIASLRNAGVKAGSGEWLAFLDSDDLWIPEKLEIQLSSLLQQNKRWGYGGFELMDKDLCTISNRAGTYTPISGWIIKDLLTTNAAVNIGSSMLERTLFDEVDGFNPDANLIFREDYEFVLRLALKAEALALPELLVRVREHTGRATGAFEYGHDRTAAVYKHFIESRPESSLVKIARKRMAGEMAESAKNSLRKKRYWQAIRKLGQALMNGDSGRHLLSVVRRGLLF